MPEDVWFASDGDRCAAWWYRAEGERRPCVVMAHGVGCTRDSGIEPYAEAFAAAGLDALLFDFRHLGASDGQPRQLVSWRRQRRDYAAALAFARTLDGVDPDRLVLWGTSYSGGHVLPVAAQDGRVAAVISQTPAVDMPEALLALARVTGPMALLRATAAGVRDALRALRGASPHLIPIVGPPGSLAVMTTPDAQPGMLAAAGPTWRNELAAREMLQIALNRPTTSVADVRCPILFVVADQDLVVAPRTIEKAAFKATGRGEVRRYPCGHFDVYADPWRSRAIADQVRFLERHVIGAREPAAAAA